MCPQWTPQYPIECVRDNSLQVQYPLIITGCPLIEVSLDNWFYCTEYLPTPKQGLTIGIVCLTCQYFANTIPINIIVIPNISQICS